MTTKKAATKKATTELSAEDRELFTHKRKQITKVLTDLPLEGCAILVTVTQTESGDGYYLDLTSESTDKMTLRILGQAIKNFVNDNPELAHQAGVIAVSI